MSILSEFVRYLGHSHFAIKSIETGKKGAQEQHFSADEISKAEDHIKQRNGKRQLWINLQKMKSDSGPSIGFSDIKSYNNLYIDLDCIKSNGFKNHAATEEERSEAISKLPILKQWLVSHGLRCGLELHTGNGAGMVLPIPETLAEPFFIAKLATFLGMLKAEIPNVDTAMFDPPRVIGIPGTLNTKQETDDRKNHMREVVGDIPDRIEDQALLDFINSLVPDPKTLESYRAKYNEPADIPHEAGVGEEGQLETEPLSSDAAERLQELFAADPIFQADLYTPAKLGKRSEAEFHLCCRLWEAGFSETEIYAIMSSSPQSKWAERPNDSYRWDTIKKAVAKAEASHKEETKGPTVLDALAILMENEAEAETGQHGKFDTWEWRCKKPLIKTALKSGSLSIECEQKFHKFLKKYEEVLFNFNIVYSDLYPLDHTPKSKKEEFTEEIKVKALDILKNGDPIQYLVDSCRRRVLGADTAFKKLACCVSVQNINQSTGLHPKMSGESSGGKTWTLGMFAHHLPREMKIQGSMSAKAGFYHSDGDRVLRILDDYKAGNEDLDTVIKQTSSNFHEPYSHRTVANYEAKTLTIGKEQTWAITSVDGSQDIQVLNRQLPINVDDSVELTKEVNRLNVERYGKGEVSHPVDEMVLVCRCMFQILRDEGYIDVVIPFYDRIEWLDISNRRNAPIFMDLLIAHTGIYRYQRQKDSEGHYLATEDDFAAARALFTDRDGEELIKRLTARERDVIMLLVSAGPEGLTRDEIAEKLSIAPSRVSQIIHGQKGAGGLMQKVQIVTDELSDSIKIEEGHTRTARKTVFSLKDCDNFVGFDGIVRLKPAPAESDNACKQAVSNPVSSSTDTSNDSVSIVSKKENKKEERDLSTIPFAENSVSHENVNLTYNAHAMASDIENVAYMDALEDSPREQSESEGIVPDTDTGQEDTRDDLWARLELTVAQFEAEGRPIVPYALADSLGIPGKLKDVVSWLAAMGYMTTNEIDSVSHMQICKRCTSRKAVEAEA